MAVMIVGRNRRSQRWEFVHEIRDALLWVRVHPLEKMDFSLDVVSEVLACGNRIFGTDNYIFPHENVVYVPGSPGKRELFVRNFGDAHKPRTEKNASNPADLRPLVTAAFSFVWGQLEPSLLWFCLAPRHKSLLRCLQQPLFGDRCHTFTRLRLPRFFARMSDW